MDFAHSFEVIDRLGIIPPSSLRERGGLVASGGGLPGQHGGRPLRPPLPGGRPLRGVRRPRGRHVLRLAGEAAPGRVPPDQPRGAPCCSIFFFAWCAGAAGGSVCFVVRIPRKCYQPSSHNAIPQRRRQMSSHNIIHQHLISTGAKNLHNISTMWYCVSVFLGKVNTIRPKSGEGFCQ